MQQLKIQFACGIREALDSLRQKNAITEDDYFYLYEDLVEGIPQMSDKQFIEYLKAIKKAKIFKVDREEERHDKERKD